MASLQLASTTPNIFTFPKKMRITSAINRPPTYLKNPRILVPNLNLPKHHQKKLVLDELKKLTTIPLVDDSNPITITKNQNDNTTTLKLHTILEFVCDRIEMHNNIREQRQNWNALLLNSLNMITLTATTMAGLAGAETPVSSLKISSVLLFTAATGMLLIMNKIQPSQLVEEQRNAVRLFKQIQARIQTTLALGNATEDDVEDAMERVLAGDRAYPLPLLNGAMIDKFPDTFKPAVWWPKKKQSSSSPKGVNYVKREKMCDINNNGWSEGLEDDMREILGVIESKDKEDYLRLGNKALKLNKMLAMVGPMLMGTAAVGSAFAGHGGVVAAVAGSLASVVNMIQHGGQVGMVLEMYRNCAGFFNLLEETVESTLEEGDLEKRENGELFEMKMALHLGRSLSELRDLAAKSRRNGGSVDGFASKLF